MEGDLGIVNNITTEMALEAGELILRHENLKNIVDDIIAHHVTKRSYVPSRQKPKAIVLYDRSGNCGKDERTDSGVPGRNGRH